MSGVLRLPNFIIVGAPKAGTTSLYAYLNQHPQVYMSPIKEPGYFAPEYGLQNYLSRWEGYLTLYHGVQEETAIGEATVCYLLSRTAAQNIAARVPHAKIIISLRNPVDRAFSQYLEMLTVGATRKSFREEIDANLRCRPDANGSFEYQWPRRPFLVFGRYHDQIKRYFNAFPRAQIHVMYYEDLQRAPARAVADLFAFLGLDPSYLPDVSRRHNEPHVPRLLGATYLLKTWGLWPYLRSLAPRQLGPRLRSLAFRARGSLTMAPADRAFLTDYYRDDVRALQLLLDRDLTSWLEPVAGAMQ
jgi:Sulfotransferase domain